MSCKVLHAKKSVEKYLLMISQNFSAFEKKWLQMPKREIIYIFHSLPTNHAAQNASSAGLKKVNQFWQKPLPRAIFLFLPITDTLAKE